MRAITSSHHISTCIHFQQKALNSSWKPGNYFMHFKDQNLTQDRHWPWMTYYNHGMIPGEKWKDSGLHYSFQMFKCFTFREELGAQEKGEWNVSQVMKFPPGEESDTPPVHTPSPPPIPTYCSCDRYLKFLASWLPHMFFLFPILTSLTCETIPAFFHLKYLPNRGI